MATPKPCGICDGPVRIVKRRGERSLDEPRAPIVETRVCTRSACPSNTGQSSLGDVV